MPLLQPQHPARAKFRRQQHHAHSDHIGDDDCGTILEGASIAEVFATTPGVRR